MSETVRCMFVYFSLSAFFGCGLGMEESVTDSLPAAITVYRNPEFFRNLTERRDSEKEVDEEEEEDKEDVYSNNSEEFYDLDDDYRYPGEPKKPNPPAAPDFTTYFDESPEFQPEPRDITPPNPHLEEEDDSEEQNELAEEGDTAQRQTASPSYSVYDENQEEDEEDRGEHYEELPRSNDKYHVELEKDLELHVPPKLYEESKKYYNPVFDEGITSFSYPSTYEDLDFYSYPYEEPKKEAYVDKKKGTREYLKYHSAEEMEEPRSGHLHADSKHSFKAISKIGFKAYKPVLYVPHIPHKIKAKYKVYFKPRKLFKWRIAREVPDDSAYQLSSDYDSDFEYF